MTDSQLVSKDGDLSSCDSEPVQFIASVQGHGCVLLFSDDFRIQSASTNVETFLGFSHAETIGARLEHILEREIFEQVANEVREYPWTSTNGRYLAYQKDEQRFDAWLYRSDGLFGLDLELSQATEPKSNDQLRVDQLIKEYMFEAKQASGLSELAKGLSKSIRKITGIDRVMVYRFLAPTWHGEVIAEERIAQAHSFMGHRFPASDIPRPARDLYLRNQLRMIVDVDEATAELKPINNPKTKKTIDLSDSRLRAVSPVHLEYLKNMGVKASFSVAIIHAGKLWGLVACHHLSKCYITNVQRSACEVIASAFASQGPVLERLVDTEEKNVFNARLRTLFGRLHMARNPKDELLRNHQLASEIFGAGGIAYVSLDSNQYDIGGLTPPRAEIEKLARWTQNTMSSEGRDVLAINDLPRFGEGFDKFKSLACGVLALQVDELSKTQFLFFRPEISETITWGGDPRKQLEKKNFSGRIHPRASFEAWSESAHGHSKPWSLYEIEGASFFRDLIFSSLMKKEQLINELSEKVHGPGKR